MYVIFATDHKTQIYHIDIPLIIIWSVSKENFITGFQKTRGLNFQKLETQNKANG